jgi:uncharacterized protein
MRFKTLNFEFKGINEAGEFEGLASVYGNEDSYGDVVEPGAFTKSISESGGKVKVFYEHRTPIGSGEVTDTPAGLVIKGRLLLGVAAAAEAYELAKASLVDGLSIGFRTVKDSWDEVNKVRRLVEVKLYEVSLVSFPANELARVTAVKSLDPRVAAYSLAVEESKTGNLSEATKSLLRRDLLSLVGDEPQAGRSAPEPRKHSAQVAAAFAVQLRAIQLSMKGAL